MVRVRMTDGGPTRYNNRGLSSPVEAGETIDVDESVAERLTANSFFEYADGGGESEDNDDNEAEEPRCGVNGCSRSVDAPEDTCWQHEGG